MEEETVESVYDIGYGYRNPCRYLQEVLNGVLRCLGLERSGGGGDSTSSEEGGGGGGQGGSGGGDGGDGGGEMDDPLTTPPSSDPPPIDEPASATGLATRRAPARPPITSGGPGQTN